MPENDLAGALVGSAPTNSPTMSHDHCDVIRDSISVFVDGFSIETTPMAAAKIDDFRRYLRQGVRVSITLLQGAAPEATIATACRLRAEGFEPVPHFPARMFRSTFEFEEYLKALKGEADVRHAVAIAGGVESPAGPYTDSMTLLESGLFDQYGFDTIGVAGHPEGNADIPPDILREAIRWKNAYAKTTDADLYIVTQFCFDAAAIVGWEKSIREAGNKLPIHIGVAGPANVLTLIKYARACGVGPSIRFLLRQTKSNVAMLATMRTPDRLLIDLTSQLRSDPDSRIAKVHVYPFGGLARSAAWFYAVADGVFDVSPNGRGLVAHL